MRSWSQARQMIYVSQAARPPLDAFVENLWWLSDAPPHARESILPGGTFELVVNLHENEFRIYDSCDGAEAKHFSGAMVSGAYHRAFVIDTLEHASIVGVHFKPGGALPFIGALPGEVGSTHIDLESVWGAHASELRERLAEATTPSRRFRILERALLARLHRPFKRHVAVPVALVRIARGERIGAVAADLGLRHRRLIELFTAEVGMAPKLFGRVQRFQQAIQAAQTARAPDWAGLALAFGYSDQAHLVRDVVAFSGLAPTELSRRGRVPVKANHVAVPMP